MKTYVVIFALVAALAGCASPQAAPTPIIQTVIVTQIVQAPTLAPLPTYTPYPTYTPAPPKVVTATPIPTVATPTSAAPQIGTFDNPVPIGKGYNFPGLGTLTVEKSLWKSGQTGYAIVYLAFACERPTGQSCDTGDFMLSAVGGSGNGYEHDFNTAIPEPTFGSFSNPTV
jgi:hypothetical protein